MSLQKMTTQSFSQKMVKRFHRANTCIGIIVLTTVTILVTILIGATAPFLTSANTHPYSIAIYSSREVSRGNYTKYRYASDICKLLNTTLPLPDKCSKIINSPYDETRWGLSGKCYDQDICVSTVVECHDVWTCVGSGRNKHCRYKETCRDVCNGWGPCSRKYQLEYFQYVIARAEDATGYGADERRDCVVASDTAPWICNATIAANITVYVPTSGFDPKKYRDYTTPPNYTPTIAFAVCFCISVALIAIVSSIYLVHFDEIAPKKDHDIFFS